MAHELPHMDTRHLFLVPQKLWRNHIHSWPIEIIGAVVVVRVSLLVGGLDGGERAFGLDFFHFRPSLLYQLSFQTFNSVRL